ncbi:pilus assembly protein CpaB [Nocardioides sp. GY 10113]|uniref:SAF domain-containing protein n=1 Tax=Nocardioides sp. GY 10113 TaxID=2569761 RepID=UPI0010A75E50|nr:SAF domain-containing protein [Nocardioides sp. GY 10113]TIC88236.1 pilus assembly protein CpaB [Nocardioides sp. GY 10113]
MPPQIAPSTPLRRVADAAHAVRRSVRRRRRPLAALCAALAVAALLGALRPPTPATERVPVAARDLPAGTTLAPGDLTTALLPPDAVPRGTLPDPTGAVLAAPLRQGEPVTDARVVGPGLGAGESDRVVVPLRLSDGDQAVLLSAGDRIDVLATDPADGGTELVAADVTVLAVPPAAASGGSTTAGVLGGRLVVVAVPASAVTGVTAAGVLSFVTYAWSAR